MQYNSYIVSETKTAFSIPMQTPIIKKNLKQKAFTLAETLITLSIIGVVAAMTVPTLMANMNKQSYVTGLKKAYSNLQNAWNMIPITENCPAGDYECAGFFERIPGPVGSTTYITTNIDGYNFNNQREKKYIYLFSKHFKNSKLYLNNENGFCDLINVPYDNNIQHACFRSEDGMIFKSYEASAGNNTGISVDVNGTKGPNKIGYDQFVFRIKEEGWKFIPEGTEYNGWKYCKTASVGMHCTARILKEGKMDY